MVEVNKTIQFNDTSTGTITLSQWDFGDGSPVISGSQVTHVYTTQGNYTVTHTVTGSTGQVQTCVQTISVTPPVSGIFGYDWKTVALVGTAAVAVLAIGYGMSKGGDKQRRYAGGY